MRFRPLAPLCAIFALVTMPAAADDPRREPGKKQMELLRALPPVEKVLAAVPKDSNPARESLARHDALLAFRGISDSLLTGGVNPEAMAIATRYRDALRVQIERTLELLGSKQGDGASHHAAIAKFHLLWKETFPSTEVHRQFQRGVINGSLEGDVKKYALDWVDGQGRVAVEKPRRTGDDFESFKEAFTGNMPEPWRTRVVSVLDLPHAVWISVCVLWVIWCLARRIAPFRLLPENVWILQVARKRRLMEASDVTVVNIRETVVHRERVTRHVDEYGQRERPDTVRRTVIREATVHMRDESGGEHTMKFTNMETDLREGHRLTVFFDEKSGAILFFYNHDMRAHYFMPLFKQFVKTRPLILIPVCALAAFAANSWLPAEFANFQGIGSVALAAGVIYLIVVAFVNASRRQHFAKHFAPRLLEAAGH